MKDQTKESSESEAHDFIVSQPGAKATKPHRVSAWRGGCSEFGLALAAKSLRVRLLKIRQFSSFPAVSVTPKKHLQQQPTLTLFGFSVFCRSLFDISLASPPLFVSY